MRTEQRLVGSRLHAASAGVGDLVSVLSEPRFLPDRVASQVASFRFRDLNTRPFSLSLNQPYPALSATQSYSVSFLLLFQTLSWLKWPHFCSKFTVSYLLDCQTFASWGRTDECVICSFYSDSLFRSLFRKNKGVCWVFTRYRLFEYCSISKLSYVFKMPTFHILKTVRICNTFCHYWIESCVWLYRILTSFTPHHPRISFGNTDLISVHWVSSDV